MESLITIRMPEEFQERVRTFCRERQYTPGDLMITLVEPSLLENLPGLEQKLQSFCLAQADFNLMVGGPGSYNNQLLYLNVMPGHISMTRTKLLGFLKVNPGDKAYRPHLTIMRSSAARPLDLNRMLADAKQSFTAPYPFTVSEIELHTRPNDRAPFKLHRVYQFTGR